MISKTLSKLIDTQFAEKLTPKRLAFIMNIFAPYFFTKIRVEKIAPDFSSCLVKIKKTFLSRNIQGSTFGGTLYSAADPFHAILYWQLFRHRGKKIEAWVKKAEILFIKPAYTDLFLRFTVTPEDVTEAEEKLNQKLPFEKVHTVELMDKNHKVYALIHITVYLRMKK